MASLGERIKAKRIELGWKQGELARKAGISSGFLSDLENNKKGIGAETLLDIARVLNASLDYLTKGSKSGIEPEIQKEIEIPIPLATVAKLEGLSFRTTLILLEMRQQIIAHRSADNKHPQDDFDWRKFYESVKDFI